MIEYTFGDIRSLLTTPSAQHWRMLTRALRQWPDAQELGDVIVPYCQNALSSWPEHLRQFDAQSLYKLTPNQLAIDPVARLSTCLTIDGWVLSTNSAAARLNLPCWSDITSVNIEYDGGTISTSQWDMVFASLCCQRIHTLRIYNVRIDQSGVDELVMSHLPTQLKGLHLDRCRLDRNADAFESLCQTDMPMLDTLGLRDGNLRSFHFVYMAEHARWPSLKALYLGAKPEDPMFADRHRFFNRSGEQAIAALVDSAIGSTIEKLALNYHQINEDSMTPLLQPNALPNLTGLDLAQNYMGKRIAAFYESDLWSRLTWLDLSRNHIGVTQTSKLFQQPNQLHTLAYNFNKIGVRGFKSLVNTTTLQQLNTLQVMDASLEREQLKQLLNTQNMPALEHLNLALNHDLPSVWDVFDASLCDQLKTLDVRNNTLRAADVDGVDENLSSMPRMIFEDIKPSPQRIEQLNFNAVKAPRLGHYFEGRGELLMKYKQSTWPFWIMEDA